MKKIKISDHAIRLILFFLAIALVMLGQGIVIPFMANLANEESITAGIITAAFSLGGLLSAPLIGNYINRIKIKNIIQIALLAYFASLVVTLLCINYIYILIIVRFISGILMATVFSSVETYVSKYEKEENQSATFLFISFANMIGMSFGPILGFYLIHSNFFTIILTLIVILFLTLTLITLIKLYLIDTETFIPKNYNSKTLKEQLLEPFISAFNEFKEMLKFPKIFYSLIGFIIFGFIVTSFEVDGLAFMMENYTKKLEHASFNNLIVEGLILLILALFYLFAVNPKLIEKYGALKVVLGSGFTGALSFLCFAFLPSLNILAIVITFAAVSIAVFSNAIVYYLSTNYENKGFILGLKNSSLNIGSIIGPLLSGFIYKINHTAYLISIPIILIGFILFGLQYINFNKK